MLGFVQDTKDKDQSFENLKMQCFYGVQDEKFVPEVPDPKEVAAKEAALKKE